MRIDQAGEDGVVREIDSRGARGDPGAGSVGNALNMVTANHNDLITAGLIGFAIDKHAGADDSYSLRRSGLRKNGNDEHQGSDQTK